MLEHVDSQELTEWRAYEIEYGPLDNTWRDEALAAIHEQIQKTNFFLGAAHFTDKTHRTNPAGEQQRYPRPHEVYQSQGDGEG